MSAIKVAGGALAAALVAITAYAAPSSASSQAEPTSAPPGEVRIQTINGSGCPAGSASVRMNSGNTSFDVSYSDFVVLSGGQAAPTEFRKNCQLSLRVDAPEGYRYAIRSVEYRGFAHLDDDARGLMQAGYYFQGSSDTDYRSKEFYGPFTDTWTVTHEGGLAWSKCGDRPNLNINAELRVYAGDDDSTSLMAMDSTRGSAKTTYHLAWEKC